MPAVAPSAASTGRRLGQLALGCVVLGMGIALLLAARLGADGYTMLISGVSLAAGVAFWIVNVVVGVLLVLLALARGRRPGVGTLAQPVLVGVTVSLFLPYVPEPESLLGRAVEFGLGFLVLALGVAMYLAVRMGAGPAEGAALAFDPPLAFKWSYSIFQAVTTCVGWALGATLGVGTLIVIIGIGPVVDRLIPILTPRGVPEID